MIHGLDTATRRWHVVADDGSYASGSVPARMPTDDARIGLAESWTEYVDRKVVPGDVIVCEEPLGLKNPLTSRVLSMAAGGLHLATFWPTRRDVLWVWADVAQWKRLIVGNGAADKDLIRRFVKGAYDQVEYEDQDHYDAHAIRDFGKLLELLAWEKPLSAKELAKLKKKDADAAVAHEKRVEFALARLSAWRELAKETP